MPPIKGATSQPSVAILLVSAPPPATQRLTALDPGLPTCHRSPASLLFAATLSHATPTHVRLGATPTHVRLGGNISRVVPSFVLSQDPQALRPRPSTPIQPLHGRHEYLEAVEPQCGPSGLRPVWFHARTTIPILTPRRLVARTAPVSIGWCGSSRRFPQCA
uniref:Uncharacterized protein n=1 Tax=Mycena chlorophos TaxID=658473 RepID=A0ABQ0LFH0_MYCCL|nr:predicted protein [Mycena chlorophos]